MNIYFEKVSRFKDVDLSLPTRATKASAGYDLSAAEDIVIPPFDFQQTKIREYVDKNMKDKDYFGFIEPFSLEEIAKIVKENKVKPAMVSTGMKCIMPSDMYLELVLRSSLPLKHWLVMANSVGIVDADYANNTDNEGEIFVPLINLSPYAIKLNRGDRIAQGIIKRYEITDNDKASGERKGGFGSSGQR